MLNRIAQAAVRELRGLGVDDLTADEIITLHVLGENQERAGKRADYVVRTIAVTVGNTVLYPPTCAAMDWFDTARVWFKNAPSNLWWAYPFSLAHGRDDKRLENLTTAHEASWAIEAWIRSLTCTAEEIDEAVGLVADMAQDTERASARANFLAAVAWIDGRDKALSKTLTDCARTAFGAKPIKGKADDAERNTEEQEREFNRWRVRCAELAALAGGSVREWYGEDTRIVTHAWTTAVDAMGARAGVRSVDKTSREMVEAIKAFRRAVADMVESRKERTATNG